MSRLIRIFTVCLVNLYFIPIFEIWNEQGRCPNLAVCPNIPDFTLMVDLQDVTELMCCAFTWRKHLKSKKKYYLTKWQNDKKPLFTYKILNITTIYVYLFNQ